MITGLTTKHTLQRERPTMVLDGRGGKEPDFTGATKVDLPGWGLDAGNTLRDAQNRDGALVAWTARGPYDADVHRHDRIIVMGEPYKIDGAVIRQPGASSLTSHTVLLLIRWEG